MIRQNNLENTSTVSVTVLYIVCTLYSANIYWTFFVPGRSGSVVVSRSVQGPGYGIFERMYSTGKVQFQDARHSHDNE